MLHAYIEFENIWQISLPQKIFTSENDFWNISMHNLGRHELHYLIESENYPKSKLILKITLKYEVLDRIFMFSSFKSSFKALKINVFKPAR